MEFHKVDFVKSVGKDLDYPTSDLFEICLAGRSNVGKSSFINSILNRKNLAYVGKTPGKTRLLNFFEVDDRFMLVDVPGYGHAIASNERLIDFGKMMEDYFDSQRISLLFLIVDLRHKPTKDDIMMIEYAKSKHLNIKVVATKLDKCKNSEIIKNKKIISETLNVDLNSIILFSSVSKKGVNEVWNTIDTLIGDVK